VQLTCREETGRVLRLTDNDVVVSPADAKVGPETIDACRSGDRAAFRTVYNAYKDKVFSIALYALHGNADLAADVTQEVFVKLMNSITMFRGDSAFSTWLYRLVANACVDAQRRAKSRHTVSDLDALERLPHPDSHEQDFGRAQTAGLVQQAISRLPGKLRVTILLRYVEDLSYEEIAVALDCSRGTVASRLNKAHRLLAATLAPFRSAQVVDK
jgi:RNA polymerase sigma-70 factor (ECF subfamily)